MYDVIIIGAGITGSFIAHNLSRYNVKVLVLEKENEICSGITKANSAIIHSGYDPQPGTLKAKLNVRGNKLYKEIARRLNVDYKEIGSYTLAFTQDQVNTLEKLYEQGKKNKVDVQIVEKERLLRSEPNIRKDVIKALYAKKTGIISPWEMVYGLLENAVSNNVEVKTNQEVIDIETAVEGFSIHTREKVFKTKFVINAAGLYAEHITRMVTDQPGYNTIPTRGEYYVIDRGYNDFVHHVIYPVPSKKGKGVLVVPTIHGNILLGPTNERVEELEKTDVTKEGMNYIREQVDNMMYNTPYQGIIRSFSGVRPKTDRGDFIIEALRNKPNFIQVAGIESPGLASSPAIAELVIELLKERTVLNYKENYKEYRQCHKRIKEKNHEEVNRLIKIDSSYGKVVCRCEQVTEGEIIDAIKNPLGATTIEGIKRRVRPGAGRCQGSFCQPLIIELLSKYLNKKKTEILLEQNGSEILVEETKFGDDCHE